MSHHTQLADLEQKHQMLESELADAMAHPSSDDLLITELKRRKLLLKDQITRLRQDGSSSVH